MELQTFKQVFRDHVPTLQQARACYAVLVPLVALPEGLALLYEVRSADLHHHAGEICFPGGKREQGESIHHCALRETEEELGISPRDIEIVGDLDFLYLRSEALMYPVLASVSPAALQHLRCNPGEVDHTLLIPVAELLAHPPTFYRYPLQPLVDDRFPYDKVQTSPNYSWQRGQMEVPVYEDLPYPLWGLTARITYWLLHTASNTWSAPKAPEPHRDTK